MKMKILFKLIGVIVLFSYLTSCSGWLDINDNPDSPQADVITESVLLPGIVATIPYELSGGFPARYVNAWVGQFSLNGLPPDIQTFRINDTDVNNTWEYTLYTNVLKNSNLLITKANVNGNKYYEGIGQILMAYSLAITTDLWGDIPLSEAFQPDLYSKPKYDSQESVYVAIFKYLDDALVNLSYTGDQDLKPGKDDLLFAGNVEKWVKFANSLKARYAMRLTYAKVGATQADIALTALTNGFTSNSDDADFKYYDKTGEENPWTQWMNKYNTLYLDTNIYNILIKYDDPRKEVFAEKAYAGDSIGKINPHRNGLSTTVAGVTSKLAIEREESNYDDGESLSPYYITKSTPVSLMSYAECCFLKAEAYLWKKDDANASMYMIEGTKASLLKVQQNNIPAFTQTQIDAYVATLPALPSATTQFEAAQKMIIELKYLANFLSTENYNDYRRTHYPSIVMPIEPQYSVVPVRMPVSTSELLYNSENAPSVNIATDKVWWDKKTN